MAQPATIRDPSTVRTFAIAGHRGAGKTSLGDVLLHVAGVTRVPGRVDEQTSLLDHGTLERRRRMTLGLSFAWLEWQAHLLELVDTPGADALEHEVSLATHAVDGVIAVVSGTAGLQLGTERVLSERLAQGLPSIVVVTHADRMGDPTGVIGEIEALTAHHDVRAVPLQVPSYASDGRLKALVGLFGPVPEELRDVVSEAREKLVEAVAVTDDALLERYLEDFALDDNLVIEGLAKAVRFGRLLPVLYFAAPTGIGAEPLLDAVNRLFPSPVERRVIFALDEHGDEVPIEADPGAPFVAQHLATRLDDQGAAYRILRVWSGSAPTHGPWVHGETGSRRPVRKLFQVRGPRAAVARYDGPGAIVATWDDLPSRPGDTWTDGAPWVIGAPPPPHAMHAWALRLAGSQRNEERLVAALDVVAAIDVALRREVCELTGGVLLEGVGTDQLERALAILRGPPFGLDVEAEPPSVAYREAPLTEVRGVEGVHKRLVDGEAVEFAQLTLDVSPAENTLEIVVEASDARLPQRYWEPAIEGIRRGLRHGPTAAYPVDGLRITITDGEYDVFASTDDHFVLAGERAIKAALEQASTRLLEPWWRIEVRSPGAEVGTVLAEIRTRRGRVVGLEMAESNGDIAPPARIFADCPYRELRSFAPRLLSLTAGRGRFSGRPHDYEPVPPNLVKEAVYASPYRTAGAA